MLENPTQLEHDGYRTYAIMTMCRMLYTAQMGEVVSKPVAARWLLAGQDPLWQPLTKAGLDWQGGRQKASVAEVQAFIEYTRAVI